MWGEAWRDPVVHLDHVSLVLRIAAEKMSALDRARVLAR